MTTVSKSQSTGAKTLRGVSRHKGYRSAFAVGFWVVVPALLLATTAGLFILFGPAPAANKNTAAMADAHRLGTIIRDNGSVRCVHGTFDNVTGSISENTPSCETTMIVEGGQAPSPLGTIHTLNAISNSFKK
ncbi:MAG TPA: hypothetical protein VHU22_09020 [Xanthobacteraceae bacterium]|nr:hypothetical protein [Xanthobacteraceae bacterium]